MTEPVLIFERSQAGRRGTCVRARNDIACRERQLPAKLTRGQSLPLPEVDETTLVRHYVRLSQINYGVDTGFYPLGSCTMKYNPKIHRGRRGAARLRRRAPDAARGIDARGCCA